MLPSSAAESGSSWGEATWQTGCDLLLHVSRRYCLMLFLMSGLTDARAADPGFCRQFAKAAISQVRGALADPRCGAGVQGARWSTDFSAHYEWCLGASPTAAGADRDARTRFLRACTQPLIQKVVSRSPAVRAAAAMKDYATVFCHDRARVATLTFRYRDGSQLSEHPCLRVRLTGSLGPGFNPWRPRFG